jgi:hypothetical protein
MRLVVSSRISPWGAAVEALVWSLSREETLKRYRSIPARLDAAIAGLLRSGVDIAAEDGKWTIRQLVHHIVDSDALTMTIITAAVGNSTCTYDQRWYDARNAVVKTLRYAERAVAPAVALYHANHHYVEEMLKRIPDAWERFVILRSEREPVGRKTTVEYLIRAQTWHALHHIEQIRATRDAHGL